MSIEYELLIIQQLHRCNSKKIEYEKTFERRQDNYIDKTHYVHRKEKKTFNICSDDDNNDIVSVKFYSCNCYDSEHYVIDDEEKVLWRADPGYISNTGGAIILGELYETIYVDGDSGPRWIYDEYFKDLNTSICDGFYAGDFIVKVYDHFRKREIIEDMSAKDREKIDTYLYILRTSFQKGTDRCIIKHF